MSPELRQTKLAEVDQEAERKRAVIEFLANFIEENRPEIEAAYLPADSDIERPAEDQIPEFLYERVADDLSYLHSEHTRRFGVTYSSFAPMDLADMTQKTPVAKLGWAGYRPLLPLDESHPQDEDFPYHLGLTDKGKEIINGLRIASGLDLTVDEQGRKNQDEWMGWIRSAQQRSRD